MEPDWNQPDQWPSNPMPYAAPIAQAYPAGMPVSTPTDVPGEWAVPPGPSGSEVPISGGSGSSHRGHFPHLNVKAQLLIERMPHETHIEKIRSIFGRYGKIARVVCEYKISEERLCVWLDYEDEVHADIALRENKRKMDRIQISVKRCSTSSEGSPYSEGKRAKKEWGGSSWSRGGHSESSTEPSPSPNWGSSSEWSQNSGESYEHGERRRSGRQSTFRGERRGGRDHRGGGGRGMGRGSRAQGYEKTESSTSTPGKSLWNDVVNPSETAVKEPDWDSMPVGLPPPPLPPSSPPPSTATIESFSQQTSSKKDVEWDDF